MKLVSKMWIGIIFKKVSSLPGTVVWQSTSFLMFVYTSCGHHDMSVWDAFVHKLWCFALLLLPVLALLGVKRGGTGPASL